MSTPPNPLVAAEQDSTRVYSGVGIVESSVDAYQGIQSGNWVEFGIGAAGAGLEALALAFDPASQLLSYGIGWLIEHVEALSQALDWLAGNPDAIRASAQTWRNAAGHVAEVAHDLAATVASDTAGWLGEAADAYRARAADIGHLLQAATNAANGVGEAVEMAGLVVAAVREIVRDLIADLVSRLIVYAAEIVFTLGFATPGVAAQAMTLIAKWAAKIADILNTLIRALSNLLPLLRNLGEVFTAVTTAMRSLRKAVPDTPGAPTARAADTPDLPTGPSTTTTTARADATSTPGTTSPASADAPTSGTTPSGATAPSAGTPSGATTPSGPDPGYTRNITEALAGPPPARPGAEATTGTTAPGTTPPAPSDPPGFRRSDASGIQHYDADGNTIPLRHIEHPDAGVVDPDDIVRAQRDPNREAILKRPGAPPDDPRVQTMTNSWSEWGNAGDQATWESRHLKGVDPDTGRRNFNWPDGQPHPDGFVNPEARTPGVLEPGTVVDRFGNAKGRFLSPADTPYEARALPPDNLGDGYHRYRVKHTVPVWMGPAAPAMGQPGGEIQYLSPYQIVDLVQAGYLEEIN